MHFGSILDEIEVPHFLKSVPRQQGIRPSLVAFPNRSVHIQSPGHPVQPTVQAITKSHHVLHVINTISEKRLENFQKLIQAPGQVPARQDLNQVTEIIRAVKRHPTHRVVTHESGRHHQLGEPYRVNPLFLILLEINPLSPQKLDGIRGVSITLHIEVAEIELPDELSAVVVGSEGRKIT